LNIHTRGGDLDSPAATHLHQPPAFLTENFRDFAIALEQNGKLHEIGHSGKERRPTKYPGVISHLPASKGIHK